MPNTGAENEGGTECDFLCEKSLSKKDPALHRLYQNSVFAIDAQLKEISRFSGLIHPDMTGKQHFRFSVLEFAV